MVCRIAPIQSCIAYRDTNYDTYHTDTELYRDTNHDTTRQGNFTQADWGTGLLAGQLLATQTQF